MFSDAVGFRCSRVLPHENAGRVSQGLKDARPAVRCASVRVVGTVCSWASVVIRLGPPETNFRPGRGVSVEASGGGPGLLVIVHGFYVCGDQSSRALSHAGLLPDSPSNLQNAAVGSRQARRSLSLVRSSGGTPADSFVAGPSAERLEDSARATQWGTR